MSKQRVSPKLIELCKWKYIEEVNKRLDSGDTPNSVCTFINANGFKISNPLIYEYAKMRKKAMVDGLNIEHMIGIARRPLIDRDDPTTKSSAQKLKSEIAALDKIIEGGYNTLVEWSDRPINPKTMMDAIKLKNELTDGHHGYLTNYGMEQLRAIEQNKYEIIMEHLINYIPENLRDEAVSKIESIEDEYYQTTDYYEEYLRARGDLTEMDIEKRLQELKAHQLELAQEQGEDTDN